MIINLLSNPRNVSTALMYSFAQHPDCAVLDEPFYAHYLSKTEKRHPGDLDVLKDQSSDFDDVVQKIKSRDGKQSLFVKNMAHHIFDQDGSWMSDCMNILFIRNPARVLYSFSKVIAKPTLEDIAIRYQWDLAAFFEKNNYPYWVLDSKDLLQDPYHILDRLCGELGLPFYEDMITWPPGPKAYDGVWAPHWYSAVWTSRTFNPYKESDVELSPELKSVYKQALPYYLDLHQKRITL